MTHDKNTCFIIMKTKAQVSAPIRHALTPAPKELEIGGLLELAASSLLETKEAPTSAEILP